MHPLLNDAPGTRDLLLGNEAIVRGALEAGVALVAAYPGTPSSEIIDTFHELAEEAGVYCEYSTNEKVAMEMAAGAAYSGARALVSMKHVGLNVALEPFMSLAYTGVRGGLVVVCADDPGCHSSQNEQDNRLLARLANVLTLEPSTPQECLELTRWAFELSERFELPVLLRTTTRVNHSRGVTAFGPRLPIRAGNAFRKDPMHMVGVPAVARVQHRMLLDRMARVKTAVETLPLVRASGTGRRGILSNGISRCYVADLLDALGPDAGVRHLELIVTHPVPTQRLRAFLDGVDSVLVAEELEPVLENELKLLIAEDHRPVDVFGKASGHFSNEGEFDPDVVRGAVLRYLGREERVEVRADPARDLPLPPRPPALCAGCPHRATYYAVKLLTRNRALYANDIGCYTLGLLPPLNMADTMLCMGASTAIAGGLARTNEVPVVAFIGDSTFFHAGIPGLVNAVNNRHRYVLVVLDNGTTAMTGHQPRPGARGDEGGHIDIEHTCRGLGVDKVHVVDPMEVREIHRVLRECLAYDGVSVVVSRHLCPLHENRLKGKPKQRVVYQVDEHLCQQCGLKAAGLHCGVDTCKATTLWRSEREVTEAGAPGTAAAARMPVAPCSATCPVNICVQGYVAHVASGQYREAFETLRGRNPLPSICGRVCHHPCEDACVRGDIDRAVAINRIKRFVTDWAAEHPEEVRPTKPEVRHDRRVAVIGAGPAGLACAHDLARRGYPVTVFDRAPEPGGLLRWGIPAYRLPREILAREIGWIRDLGVEFRCGVEIGRDLTLEELRQTHGAVFLAVGAGRGQSLGIAGEDAPGVLDAVRFLERVNRGDATPPAEPVVVIGGGNAAVDAARTALRLGARDVRILYRRSREEMPAIREELEAAEAEGVTLELLAAPRRIVAGSAGVQAVECVRMELGEPDESGRRRPLPKPGSDFPVAARTVIAAIGQRPEFGFLGPVDVGSSDSPWLGADPETGHTRVEGVFAGGDAVTGPGSVIQAIAAGRRAAHAIDRSLAADPAQVEPLAFYDPARLEQEPRFRPLTVEKAERVEPSRLPAEEARRGFLEAEATYSEAAAQAEAQRCLACGLCANCSTCIDHFSCVALYREGAAVRVNETLCNGCGVCAQLCANHAFVRVVKP